MGQVQHSNESGACARGRRLGWRTCLCKDCGRGFQARSYNQRYCREPECQRRVDRWHAAKRQRKCRAAPEGRRQHAEAERQRRQRKASQAGLPQASEAATTDTAAEPRAWSRSEKHPEVFCDRPGCYEPVRNSPRAPARYCSDACRAAVERARDRERKWLLRNREVGRFKRHLEYQAARVKRCCRRALSGGSAAAPSSASPQCLPAAVQDYGLASGAGLNFKDSREANRHDPQTDPCFRPRAPPA